MNHLLKAPLFIGNTLINGVQSIGDIFLLAAELGVEIAEQLLAQGADVILKALYERG